MAFYPRVFVCMASTVHTAVAMAGLASGSKEKSICSNVKQPSLF